VDDADDYIVDPTTGEIISPTQGVLEMANHITGKEGLETEPLPIRFVKETIK
jgi:hypothetical protein